MKTKYILSLLLTCLSLSAHAVSDGGGSSVGIGNPAAKNCDLLGGTLGEVRPDGRDCSVEQWHLFSEMYKRGLVKHHDYPGIGMPNPAAVNCNDIKGVSKTEHTESGDTTYCVVEEWDLFRAINIINEHR